MLTALVVDADAVHRARVAELLATTGRHVVEAATPQEGLRLARRTDLDLVVSDVATADGPALLRRLRLLGCRAHLLGLAADVTPALERAASAAGALAVLRKPLDAGMLLRFLLDRTAATAPGAADPAEDPAEDPLDGALTAQLQEMYARALPTRLAAIDSGARAGDAPALASASVTLAGASSQLGHPEVAALCAAIARDARRGVLAHDLVRQLTTVAVT